MKYIKIGKITNTHGIKGELRILSSLPSIDVLLKPNSYIYMGETYQKKKILTHRLHKGYHMVTLEGIDHIEKATLWKGKMVFKKRDEIETDDYFDEDYIGLEAYSNRYLGKVVNVRHLKAQDLLVIQKEKKQYLVPKLDVFIDSIDIKNNKIYIIEIEGLFDEN